MHKLLTKQNLINTILIAFVLSIFLDLHIFYNSISTMIRVGFISTMFLIIFIKYSTNKEKMIFISYFIVLGIYLIIHLINVTKFSVEAPTTFNVLSEILYFYKMIMSIFIIYIVYKLKINFKNLAKFIKVSLWIICGSIVIANIFKLGYSTYSFDPIKANIFTWFNKNNNIYREISSKGYFHLANQIIAIILLYYPILINELKENLNIKNILLSCTTLLSMLILGNRLSTIGPLIILLFSFFSYLFLIILKIEKFNKKFFSFLLVTILGYNIFLFNSPLLKRENYYNDMINLSEKVEIKPCDTVTMPLETTSLDLIDRFNDKLINLNFPLSYYKYENDPEFWEEMLTQSPVLLRDSRYLEISIIKRVKNLNENAYDNWFGIGYDRIINIFNIERDYVMQYYSVGIVGTVLLLGAYFVIYIKSAFKVLLNMENKFNFKFITLFIGVSFFLIAAYYSGNILNATSTIIPISFVLGVLLNESNKKANDNNQILGFNIPLKTSKELIKDLKTNINDGKQKVIYNINPLIIMNFYKNKKVKKEFNSSKYNIPDGIGTVYASKMKNIALKERIAGIDFFKDLCNLSIEKELSIFLYGSEEGIADKVKKELEEKYHGINIAGTLNGYVKESEALKKIKEAQPDILFVALGSPLQEKFIIKNKKQFSNIKIIMPVGGTFDVIAGKIKRAPKIIIKLNLEWIYRMLKEPKRAKVNINIFKYLFLVIFRNNCYNINERKGDL